MRGIVQVGHEITDHHRQQAHQTQQQKIQPRGRPVHVAHVGKVPSMRHPYRRDQQEAHEIHPQRQGPYLEERFAGFEFGPKLHCRQRQCDGEHAIGHHHQPIQMTLANVFFRNMRRCWCHARRPWRMARMMPNRGTGRIFAGAG
jgi:hypothetical protein